MSLKPKTVRRMTLLGLVGFLVLGTAFSLLVVRRWQNNRTTTRLAEEALTAHEAGRPYQALVAAANYIKRANPGDPRFTDLLKVYADSRLKVEEHDYTHIRQAIAFYQRYIERRPEDRATRLLLLDLMTQAQYWAEARDLAARLLPEDVARTTAADIPVLRAEAMALYGTHNRSDRLFRVLDRLAELQPLNLRNETIRLQAFSQANHPEQARASADAVLAAHPDDPRAELLVVISRMIDRKPAEAEEQWQRVCHAAGLDPKTAARVRPASFPDPEFATSLVEVFDQVNAFDHSLQVLLDAAPVLHDTSLDRVLVRRLWQEGRFREVDERTAGLDPAKETSHAELVGFRALALYSLNRADESRAIAKALEGREGDYRSTCWSKAIPLADPATTVRGTERVDRVREVVKASPLEPVFLLMLGDSLAAVGRADDARKYWGDAAKNPLATGWPTPSVRIAENCLNEGRYEEAAEAARLALNVAPNRIALNVLWFESQCALIQRGSRDAVPAQTVLDRVERTVAGLEQRPAEPSTPRLLERLLPSRVLLLSRAGQRDKALEAARAGLAAPHPPSEETLRRLISVSDSERLGLEAELLAMAESRFGASAPVALSRALEKAAAGDPEGGLEHLRKAAAADPGSLAMQVAIARYLERIGNGGALKAWIEVGDKNPTSLEAQRACLTADAVSADREFVERTIKRYTGLMGLDASEDHFCRCARARALVFRSPSRRDRDEAVAILSGVVATNASLIEPKLMLAAVLALSDPSRDIRPELPRAVAQLTDAAAREPRSARVALELARLYQATREWDRAREQLTRVAGDPSFDADSRSAAARLLIAQGEPGPLAVSTLAGLARQQGEATPPTLLLSLAQAHTMLRQDEKARAVYDQLVARGAEPESVLAAARFYAAHGEKDKADAALARLGAMTLSPGQRELVLARFEAENGDPEKAAALFESAVKADPKRIDAWQHYAGFRLARGQQAETVAILDRALATLPGESSLVAQRELARASAATGGADLKPLIEVLAREPATTEAAQTLRVVQEAAQRGELASIDDLTALAERHPTSAPLQMYAARRLSAQAPERAVPMTMRAQAAAPADPAPPRLAAEIYLRLGRWSDMLAAATAWRERDFSYSPEADIAIAEAYLNLRQPEKGLETLAPRIQAALASPANPVSLSVINIQARLLVAADRVGEARDLLRPLLPNSRDVRLAIWLVIAGRDVPSLDDSRAWIAEVRPLLGDTAEEQLVLVTVYDALSGRHPGEAESLLNEAKELLARLAANPGTATAPVLEALGVFRHRTGDLTGAEAAYQRAVELDPHRAMALNNLANLALERGDYPQALALATRAVEAAPTSAYTDTLGQVQHAIADKKKTTDPQGARPLFKASAETFLRAALSAPGDLNPLQKAAADFNEAGEYDRAISCCESMLRTVSLSDRRAALIKNNLAQLLVKVGKPDDLERARLLAEEAVRSIEEPATLDTWAWAELSLGRARSAAEKFRRALTVPGMTPALSHSSTIGLALALAEGTPAERQECEQLLGTLRAETIEPELLPQYERARATLRSANR